MRSCEKSENYPFVRDIYIYREISICKVTPLYLKEKNDSKSLEILINEEGMT